MNKRIAYLDAAEEVRELISGDRLHRLEQLGSFEIYYGNPGSLSEYANRMGSAAAIILGWYLPLEVLKSNQELEIVSCMGIDFADFIDLAGAARQGITVCNTPGYGNDAIAEHALALMLAAARNLPGLDADLRSGDWHQSFRGTQLRGKRIGVIGFGSIGQRFVSIVKNLGMKVCIWTRRPEVWRKRLPDVEFVSMESLLTTSDFISIHLALTPETRRLLGPKAFSIMKPGAILINTARGEIIDEGSLVSALKTGRLKAAGLDVYSREPLPPDSPLCRLLNVVLTPHVAYNTIEATEALHDIAIDNLVSYFQGKPINVVAAPEMR